MTESYMALSIGTNTFEVSGSEQFVQKMFDQYAKPWVENATTFPGSGEDGTGSSARASLPRPADKSAGSSNVTDYENVFDFADDELKVICDVGGSNNAEKTRRTALTYLFGQSLLGETIVQSEQIRAACSDQGCYDSANFAQYLKSLKNKVVMNTKAGGGYAVKLTAPGRNEAKTLVAELNEAVNG